VKRLVIALAVLLAACDGSGAGVSTSSGASDGGSSSSSASSAGSSGSIGGSTSSTGTGGQGGAGRGGASSTGGSSSATGGGGSAGAACPPFLGFDPTVDGAGIVGPYVDEYGGFFAVRLSDSPLAAAVECKVLVVGLGAFSNPSVCAVPPEIHALAWSDIGEIDAGTGEVIPAKPLPASTTFAVGDAAIEGFGPGLRLYRFPLLSTFAAGEYPFAAFRLDPAICGVLTHPGCDGVEPLRYRPAAPGAGWSPLDKAKPDAPPQIPDLVGYQLAIGVEDCN